jgi:very-short-patch-repair endonuclease
MVRALHRRLPGPAVLSGRTAGWLYGLDLPAIDPFEVTALGTDDSADWHGVRVRWRALTEAELGMARGLPVTSPVRTVIDLGRDLPFTEAVVAVDVALKCEMVNLPDLQQYLEQHPGCFRASRLRRILALAEPRTESPMETRLRLLLVLGGLPRPAAQVALHDAAGRFIARPDLFYGTHRLAIEFDGGTHRDSLVEDNRRQNRMLSAGYRLLRFTAADLRTPDVVLAQVRAALAA